MDKTFVPLRWLRLRLFLTLLVICGYLFVRCGAAFAEDPAALVVRVGMYENKPKIYTNEAGKVTGIFPDILTIIAQREHWQLQYIPGSWTDCLERLEQGEIDVMVDVAYSEARAKRYDFSVESVFVNWGVVYARQNLKAESLLDLQGKKVAVMKGSIHTDGAGGIKKLLEQFHVQCLFVEVDNYNEVLALLDSGQADLGVVNRLFGALNENRFNAHKTSIIFNPRHLKFAFSQNGRLNSQLIPRIDANLKALKNQPDSPLIKIIDAHLNNMPYPAASSSGPEIKLSTQEQDWISAHPLIRVGVDPEFLPFEYLGADGLYHGMASDYLKLLNRRLGVNLQVVPNLSWSEVIKKAKNKEIDVLPCVGMTGERRKYLNFSIPYLEFQRVIVTRSDLPFIAGIDDLVSKQVAVQAASSHEGFVKEKTDLKPVPFPTLQAAILVVSEGEVEAFIGNAASTTYWIRQLNLTNLKVAAPVSTEMQQLHFAVRNDWPELISIINKGLINISRAERDEIYQRWLAAEYKPGLEMAVLWKYIAYVLAAALIGFVFFTLWNWRLKQEIAERKSVEHKLQFKVDFERFITELSSRFINLQPDEIGEHIEKALSTVASFTGVDLMYVLELDENGLFSCPHIWHSEGLSIDRSGWSNLDRAGIYSWLSARHQEIRAFETAGDVQIDLENSEKDWLNKNGIASAAVVPRSYQGRIVGSLGFGSRKEGRSWTADEISLFNLVGQIFTQALLRKEEEEARQAHARELEQKSTELEKSQQALTFLLEDVNEAKLDLERANKKLKELDQLKSMFIASMSHELRTPLNSIIGFTGIILQGLAGEINAEQQDQLSRVYSSAKHLLSLITDVIDISKIEAGKIEPYPEVFKLEQVIEEAVNNIKTQLKDKGLDLQIRVPPGLEIESDRRRLLQCILNVLSNAVKYSEQGAVSIEVAQEGGQVRIDIADTGIGISDEDQNRLFESFVRFDSHLKMTTAGTGLGLYLTRKLAREVLGGDVAAVSKIGEGSTFSLIVPMKFSKNQQANEHLETGEKDE